MVTIVTDNESFTVAKADDLTKPQLAKIFPADANKDVLRTFVVTTQPTSRRAIPASD